MNKAQTFTAILLLAMSATALAGGHRGAGVGPGDGMFMGGGDGSMGIPPKLAERLNLSEQQQQDMLALTGLYGPRLKEIADRGKADRQTLAAMAPDDPSYGDYAGRVSQEAGLAAAESVTLMTELQSNIYALLDEEQQAEYMAMRVEMRERMEARRDAMREGGMPHKHGDCTHHAEMHSDDTDADASGGG